MAKSHMLRTLTVRDGAFRADVVVVPDHGDAFEQVHIVDGPDAGMLLHSAKFDANNLGPRVYNDRKALREYATVMLSTAVSEYEQKRGKDG